MTTTTRLVIKLGQETVATMTMQTDDLCGLLGLSWSADRTVATMHVHKASRASVWVHTIGFCHTKLLPPDCDIVHLLHMMQISIPGVKSAALAEITKRLELSGGQMSNAFAMTLFAYPIVGATPAVVSAARNTIPMLQGILSAMQETPLLQDHVDALDVMLMNDAETIGEALHGSQKRCPRYDLLLPHLTLPALSHLLKGRFLARSEASVVMMVHAWMSMPHGLATSLQQRRDITASLRLGQLTRGLSFETMSLPWSGVTASQSMDLAMFATLTPQEQAACGAIHPGTAWCLPSRTCWPGMETKVTGWRLDHALLPAVRLGNVRLPSVFVNGYIIHVLLATSPRRVGCSLWVAMTAACSNIHPSVTSCTIQVDVTGKRDVVPVRTLVTRNNRWAEIPFMTQDVETMGCCKMAL